MSSWTFLGISLYKEGCDQHQKAVERGQKRRETPDFAVKFI